MPAERDDAPEPTDPEPELTEHSDRILDAIAELHRLEVEKRTKEISTPEFHRLAEEITAKSREVFRIAAEQERLGEAAPQGSESIDDLDREGQAKQA